MEFIKFDGVNINEVMNRMPDKVKNDLPFGLLKLDPAGTILEYNMGQEAITGILAKDVIGKNFFLDVAVCTQRPEFYGKFKEGLVKGVLNQIFDYVFDYRMVPTRVRVHMFTSTGQRGEKIIWLMVKKMARVDAPNEQSNAPVVQTVVPYDRNAIKRETPALSTRAAMPIEQVTNNSSTDAVFGDIMIEFEQFE